MAKDISKALEEIKQKEEWNSYYSAFSPLQKKEKPVQEENVEVSTKKKDIHNALNEIKQQTYDPMQPLHEEVPPEQSPAAEFNKPAERFMMNVPAGMAGTSASMVSMGDWWFDSEKAREASKKLEQIQKNLTPEDPGFWDYATQALGSSLMFYVPALAAMGGIGTIARVSPIIASLTGASFQAVSEALVESPEVYKNVLKATGDRDKAVKQAWKAFATEIPGDVALNLPLFSEASSIIGKTLKAGAGQTAQEMWQSGVSQGYSNGKIDPLRVAREGLIAAPSSFVLGGISAASDVSTAQQAPQITGEQVMNRPTIQQALEDIKAQQQAEQPSNVPESTREVQDRILGKQPLVKEGQENLFNNQGKPIPTTQKIGGEEVPTEGTRNVRPEVPLEPIEGTELPQQSFESIVPSVPTRNIGGENVPVGEMETANIPVPIEPIEGTEMPPIDFREPELPVPPQPIQGIGFPQSGIQQANIPVPLRQVSGTALPSDSFNNAEMMVVNTDRDGTLGARVVGAKGKRRVLVNDRSGSVQVRQVEDDGIKNNISIIREALDDSGINEIVGRDAQGNEVGRWNREQIPEPEKDPWDVVLEERERERQRDQEDIEAELMNNEETPALSRPNLMKRIRELGGLNYNRSKAAWGESETRAVMERNGPSLFRSNGLPADIMVQELQSSGIPVKDVNDLWEKLATVDTRAIDPVRNAMRKMGISDETSFSFNFINKISEFMKKTFSVEQPFRDIGAPKTGQKLKNFFGKIDTTLESFLHHELKQLNDLKLTDEEYQFVTFLSATPRRHRNHPLVNEKTEKAYKIARGYLNRMKENAFASKIMEREFPQSLIKRLKDDNVHYRDIIRKYPGDRARVAQANVKIKQNQAILDFLENAKVQYVPIPMRLWFQELMDKQDHSQVAKLITQYFHQRKVADLEEFANFLIDRNIITSEQVDIRRILADYTDSIAKKLAMADIFNSAIEEGLVMRVDQAPHEWVSLPAIVASGFKGYRMHPVLEEYLRTNFLDNRGSISPMKALGVNKALGWIKMAQFYNPVFLPVYDLYQGIWLGSMTNPKVFKYIRKGFKSGIAKDQDFFNAMEYGAFSQPFVSPYGTWIDRVNDTIENDTTAKKMLSRLENPKKWIPSIYQLSWSVAWGGDRGIRMASYFYLLDKGYTPQEAAQYVAMFHGDYASIPPHVKKILNTMFFTPSFKIAMTKAQGRMIGAGMDYVFKGRRDKDTKLLAKGIVMIIACIAARDWLFKSMGFKTQDHGLRYYKEVDTEMGPRELVVYTPTPDNIALRYISKIKRMPDYEHWGDKFLGLIPFNPHPAYDTLIRLLMNRDYDYNQIFNSLDSPTQMASDIGSYIVKRLIPLTEVVKGLPTSKEKNRDLEAMKQEFGNISYVLDKFVLPYTRSTKDKRAYWEIQRAIQNFKTGTKDESIPYERQMQRKEKLQQELREIVEELKK